MVKLKTQPSNPSIDDELEQLRRNLRKAIEKSDNLKEYTFLKEKAEYLGISESEISRYLSEDINPSLKKLLELQKLLSVPIIKLVDVEEELSKFNKAPV